MPVKKNWYRVEEIVNKRNFGGVNEYKTKFSGCKKLYWIPYYNITPDLVEEYENRVRQKNTRAREYRKIRRAMKRELGEPLEEVPIPGRPPKRRNLKW